jgi:hypothetical protein
VIPKPAGVSDQLNRINFVEGRPARQERSGSAFIYSAVASPPSKVKYFSRHITGISFGSKMTKAGAISSVCTGRFVGVSAPNSATSFARFETKQKQQCDVLERYSLKGLGGRY